MVKFNFSKILFLPVIFILPFFGCDNHQIDKLSSNNYSKIEIYGWCFSYDPVQEAKGNKYPGFGRSSCESFIAIRPSEVIRPKHFYDSTSNSRIIDALKKTIFDGKNAYKKSDQEYPDTRFLILFKKNELDADTVVYGNPNIFYYNSKYILNYSFNVVDSIRRILGKEKIYCKD